VQSLGQCARLRTGAERALIVIEGPELTETIYNVHPRALRGAVFSISTWWQIPIVRTQNLAGTVEYLTMTALQSRVHAGLSLPRHGRRPKRLSTRQLHVLQGLPGVGREIAGRLLQHFGSVRAVFAASASDLVGVDGIGRKRVEAIARVLDAGRPATPSSRLRSPPRTPGGDAMRHPGGPAIPPRVSLSAGGS
jgi:ERCC4-type nuclease